MNAGGRPRLLAAGLFLAALVAALSLASGVLAPPPPPVSLSGASPSGLPLDQPPETGATPGPVTPASLPPATVPPPGSATPTPAAAPSPTLPGERVAVRIRIAELGIDLPISEGDGYTAPLNKAAHYPGTAWPGGGSNIYLYGHAREGMFIDLWRAEPGQRVELVLADGDSAFYTIATVLPRVLWNDMSMIERTPTEELRLQTCVSYGVTSPRFVVVAVPATAPAEPIP